MWIMQLNGLTGALKGVLQTRHLETIQTLHCLNQSAFTLAVTSPKGTLRFCVAAATSSTLPPAGMQTYAKTSTTSARLECVSVGKRAAGTPWFCADTVAGSTAKTAGTGGRLHAYVAKHMTNQQLCNLYLDTNEAHLLKCLESAHSRQNFRAPLGKKHQMSPFSEMQYYSVPPSLCPGIRLISLLKVYYVHFDNNLYF